MRPTYKKGGKIEVPGGPFEMSKESEDKAKVHELKGDKRFMRKAKKEEKQTERVMKRKGGGAEGLKKLERQLEARAKRKRKRKNRQEKRQNRRAGRALGREMMRRRVGKALGRGNSISAHEAGCQGKGCGAYE